MKRRVAVFGADGFLGRGLVSALSAVGTEVHAIGRKSWLAADGAARAREPGDARVLIDGCDAVAWLAGGSTPGSSAGAPLMELTNNVRPLIELLEALAQQPHALLLYASSGGAIYGDLDGTVGDESLVAAPKSNYAAGKGACELFIHAARHQDGGAAIILRPSNVYGPGQKMRTGFGIIPTSFAAIRSGAPLQIWGDGSESRDYLFIDDFVELAMATLSTTIAGVRTFNVASGETVSLDRLMTTIENASGHIVPRTYLARRVVDVSHVLLDGRAAFDTFGWRARTRIEDGIAATWSWFETGPE